MKGKEVIQTIGVTRQTLSRYVTSGLIKVTKESGRRYDYDDADVMELAKRKEEWKELHDPAQPNVYAKIITSQLGYNLDTIRSSSRSRMISDRRRIIAKLLSIKGWGHERIGQFLNRNHSSVTFMLQTSYLVEEEIQNAIKLIEQLNYGKEKEK